MRALICLAAACWLFAACSERLPEQPAEDRELIQLTGQVTDYRTAAIIDEYPAGSEMFDAVRFKLTAPEQYAGRELTLYSDSPEECCEKGVLYKFSMRRSILERALQDTSFQLYIGAAEHGLRPAE